MERKKYGNGNEIPTPYDIIEEIGEIVEQYRCGLITSYECHNHVFDGCARLGFSIDIYEPETVEQAMEDRAEIDKQVHVLKVR